MPLAADANHVRLVQLYDLLLLHAEQRKYMRPEVWARLEAMGGQLRPALAIVGTDSKAYEQIEKSFDAAHKYLARLLHGVRYVWFGCEEILSGLGTLTVGDTPEQDSERLGLLLDRIPGIVDPPFLWAKGISLAIGRQVLTAHRDGLAQQEMLDKSLRGAAKLLRDARPESAAAWRKDYAPWIRVNIPGHEAQVAWGIERRSLPRKKKTARHLPSPPPARSPTAPPARRSSRVTTARRRRSPKRRRRPPCRAMGQRLPRRLRSRQGCAAPSVSSVWASFIPPPGTARPVL